MAIKKKTEEDLKQTTNLRTQFYPKWSQFNVSEVFFYGILCKSNTILIQS